LSEAFKYGSDTYWFTPQTKEVISAHDHGETVMENPDKFGIDLHTVQDMYAAFSHEDDEDGNASEDDTGGDISDLKHELWGDGNGWHENDAWEQLGMNHGWVRVGGASMRNSCYLSAATSDAAWYGVKHVLDSGAATDRIEIEISRPTNQIYTTLSGAELDAFIKRGPKKAESTLRHKVGL
jgi:hypothetical protein